MAVGVAATPALERERRTGDANNVPALGPARCGVLPPPVFPIVPTPK